LSKPHRKAVIFWICEECDSVTVSSKLFTLQSSIISICGPQYPAFMNVIFIWSLVSRCPVLESVCTFLYREYPPLPVQISHVIKFRDIFIMQLFPFFFAPSVILTAQEVSMTAATGFFTSYGSGRYFAYIYGAEPELIVAQPVIFH
jgi:hypothetical protein